jgi:hypothetical protein
MLRWLVTLLTPNLIERSLSTLRGRGAFFMFGFRTRRAKKSRRKKVCVGRRYRRKAIPFRGVLGGTPNGLCRHRLLYRRRSPITPATRFVLVWYRRRRRLRRRRRRLTLTLTGTRIGGCRGNYASTLFGFRTLPERFQMYLTTLDMLAVMIALVVSVTLVITTALANARLTRSRNEYRVAYLDLKRQVGK